MSFERFRPRLRALVHILLNPKLQALVDASGVVQQTLLDAHRNQAQCRGTGEAVQYGWVRRMLENDLKDAIKKAARSPGYEAAILETSARIDQWISVSGASPATHVAWMEQVERLVEAVENLPDDQRTAVELHHLQQCSFKETARRMGKTRSSVTSLVNRGVKAIRKALGELGRP